MPRASRHYIPGHIWHITHRCHRQQFLLKFARDRERWMQWLCEARKRFGLRVLDYTVTCNHVHLLVQDGEGAEVIPQSIQLVAGRIAQEYNQRKKRVGAFWQDRYHATAVESGEHLRRCLVYIDLNMVRAGAVGHPSEWAHGGFNEIQKPRRRNQIIDYDQLCRLLGHTDYERMRAAHRRWVADAVAGGALSREPSWSEAVAVGGEAFVSDTKQRLGALAGHRKVVASEGRFELREDAAAGYGADFGAKMSPIGSKNAYFWSDFS